MWWIDQLTNGINKPVSVFGIVLFSKLFSLCCLLKFSIETKRGYFHYFNEDSFLYGLYQIKDRLFYLKSSTYKLVYILKWVAAFSLLMGLAPRVSLLILLVSFFIEIKIYFKYHTNYFLLVCASLLFSESLSLNLRSSIDRHGSALPQLMIMGTLIVMYLASAYRKMNPVFISGLVVYSHLKQTIEQQTTRIHFDGFYPKLNLTKRVCKYLRPLMLATVIFEILIPIGLCFDTGFYYAAAAGVFLHICFTLLYPATLAHFSLVTVCSYVLFIDPDKLKDLFF